jgi:hypothetical protein
MISRAANPRKPSPDQATVAVDLSAVLVSAAGDDPKVLAVRSRDASSDALPSGPLEQRHHTLEAGLRAWVAERTRQGVGYVEQLYTFGDRDRYVGSDHAQVRVLSIGYLALVPEARTVALRDARWRDWYDYFPWEDRRAGRPAPMVPIERELRRWAAGGSSPTVRRAREERVGIAFGFDDSEWNDERVLERYELLYEVGLVREARRDRVRRWASAGQVLAHGEAMAADHRRILATAIARLRGKIKYRPVVFELMPPEFTLLQLQRTVECLAGVRLHKPNFRRLVENQGLIEETGEMSTETRGRPARLVRFRRDVLLERPGAPVRLPVAAPRSK